MAFLIAAYACIIVTLYLDLGQIRKMRKRYAAQMSAAQTKESRAEQKKRKAAQRKAAKEAEEKRKEEEERKANENDNPQCGEIDGRYMSMNYLVVVALLRCKRWRLQCKQ